MRTNAGVEFKGDFHSLCIDAGINHHVILTKLLWSNGVDKWCVRTIKSYLKHLALMEGEINWPLMLPNV